jgi:acetyltransferase-like isoleucine patch superfamily enzyme
MAPPTTRLAGVKARSLDLGRRARTSAGSLRSSRRTALRVPGDRVVPAPRAFARFGADSWIVPPARVHGAEAIEVGAGVVVLEGCGLDVDAAGGARLVIGDRVRLAKGAEIVCTTHVEIGDAVSSSDFVTVTDSWALLEGPAGAPPPPPSAPVVIEEGAYLAWGSIICPGVRVGAGAFIGEGAVVMDDVAPHTVVYGNPARPVRHHDAATGAWIGERFG